MSEETIDEIVNNKQSNDNNESNKPKQLIPTFNKWGTHRRSTTIGNNISIRFGKTISLGIKYYDKNMNKLTKKYGLSFDDFVYRINKLPINKQKIFFLTFMDTMSLKYISEHFVCWNDIKNNTLWKLSVEQYLFELIHKIINAYKNNILKKPSFIKNEQFLNKIHNMHKKYLKHIKSFEKQKKRKLDKLKNDTNENQTENERNQNQTNEINDSDAEPPLKKRKIESLPNTNINIKIETTTSPISPTSDTSTSTTSSTNSTSIAYSNITIPDFNQFNVNSIPNFNTMPQFNIPSINNTYNNTYNTFNTINNNISENYLNISAINNQLEILETGQKQEQVQQQMQQIQQQLQLQLQTEQCQLPYEPQFLPNINMNNLNDLNNYNMNMNGQNNNNEQDVITVRYRIRVDWNGISIQQL